MKKCFVSVVSDHYIDSFLTLLYSIKKHNPKIDLEWRIFTNNEWCSLNEKNKKSIIALWPGATFVDVDIDPYRNINAERAINCFNQQNEARKNGGGDARSWFMKFNILLFRDVDLAVYLDSDILCTGDISALVNLKHSFGVVFRRTRGGKEIIKTRQKKFNAGVLVIGKTHMNIKTHNILIKYANKNNKNGDQEAWWKYLNGKKVWSFGKHYNRNPIKYNQRTKLIHFWGAKPNERIEKRIADNVWDRYYNEMREIL